MKFTVTGLGRPLVIEAEDDADCINKIIELMQNSRCAKLDVLLQRLTDDMTNEQVIAKIDDMIDNCKKTCPRHISCKLLGLASDLRLQFSKPITGDIKIRLIQAFIGTALEIATAETFTPTLLTSEFNNLKQCCNAQESEKGKLIIDSYKSRLKDYVGSHDDDGYIKLEALITALQSTKDQELICEKALWGKVSFTVITKRVFGYLQNPKRIDGFVKSKAFLRFLQAIGRFTPKHMKDVKSQTTAIILEEKLASCRKCCRHVDDCKVYQTILSFQQSLADNT